MWSTSSASRITADYSPRPMIPRRSFTWRASAANCCSPGSTIGCWAASF